MIATLSTNHHDLSDWLLLAAFIVFLIAAIATAPWEPRLARIPWVPIGLALLTLALFVV